MGTGAESHNFILIEHLAPFEISVGCLVVDDSIHDEEYVSWVAALLAVVPTRIIQIKHRMPLKE